MSQLVETIYIRIRNIGRLPLCNGKPERAPHIGGVCFGLYAIDPYYDYESAEKEIREITDETLTNATDKNEYITTKELKNVRIVSTITKVNEDSIMVVYSFQEKGLGAGEIVSK